MVKKCIQLTNIDEELLVPAFMGMLLLTLTSKPLENLNPKLLQALTPLLKISCFDSYLISFKSNFSLSSISGLLITTFVSFLVVPDYLENFEIAIAITGKPR